MTAPLVAEAAPIPGLLAAATLRTGDCAHIRAADLDEAVPAGPAPDVLVRYGLAAKAAETCDLEASLVDRLRSGALEAAASAGSGGVGERWASAEVGCLLDGALSDAARSTGKVVADAYLATVVGPDPFPAYTSENLYAALRLRELAADGCDGRGWWTGVYAAS